MKWIVAVLRNDPRSCCTEIGEIWQGLHPPRWLVSRSDTAAPPRRAARALVIAAACAEVLWHTCVTHGQARRLTDMRKRDGSPTECLAC